LDFLGPFEIVTGDAFDEALRRPSLFS